MEEQPILLKPGQQIKPYVPVDLVHSLAQNLFNLEVSSVKELNSYDDRNFYIKVKDDSVLPDPKDACKHGYILKVLNSLDSKSSALIDAQNKMMLFLSKRNIPCPTPVKNIHGTEMHLEELKVQVDEKWFENNDSLVQPTEKYIVRLLSFVPGEILFSVPYTSEIFYQVGEIVAKTDLALMEFNHEALRGVDRIWNLSAVPKLKEFVFAVQDEARRALAVQVIENFQSSVVPHYGKLACGPIHGDLNEQNILVQPVDGQTDKHFVSGILDFGDIHHNFYIFDIAIAICYMMLECKSMDILDAPGHVLAGYCSLRPMPDLEFDLLKDCISGRICQSVVMGAYSYSQNPDPYLLTTAKTGWVCLEKLWAAPKQLLCERWRTIMNGYCKDN